MASIWICFFCCFLSILFLVKFASLDCVINQALTGKVGVVGHDLGKIEVDAVDMRVFLHDVRQQQAGASSHIHQLAHARQPIMVTLQERLDGRSAELPSRGSEQLQIGGVRLRVLEHVHAMRHSEWIVRRQDPSAAPSFMLSKCIMLWNTREQATSMSKWKALPTTLLRSSIHS